MYQQEHAVYPSVFSGGPGWLLGGHSSREWALLGLPHDLFVPGELSCSWLSWMALTRPCLDSTGAPVFPA